MQTRRDFLRLMSRLFVWSVTTIGLGLSRVPAAFAKIAKRIIPKGTDPQSLRTEDPEFLDTRNLQVMPLEEFGTMGDEDVPFNPDVWRLEVIGAVKTPLQLAYDEILNLSVIEREVLLICPGVFANHGRWKGISILELMRRADPLINASKVIIHGRSSIGDREEQFKIEEVKSDKVFLAYAVNGRTLPRKHGFPLRVVAEGHWGFRWAKYVHKVEFV